jgi:L-aminopeptidase/D-esterase-like protein
MPQITDIPGITVGHASDAHAATGCTVVVCRQGAVGGVDVRGAAPGTRETDALRPMTLVERVHAVLLTGGSAFGLAAADGVVRYLEEQGIGFDAAVAKVPIVPAAVIFDLMIGSATVRPTAEMGYAATRAATRGPVEEGSVGAGCGATVGKLLGMRSAMKGGVGTWAVNLPGGVIVGALVVVNGFGDVLDEHTGQVLAGARDPATGRFLNTADALIRGQRAPAFTANSTLGVVATNAALTKEQANKLAQLGHDGLAWVISPVHTMIDGDTIFALSIGTAKADAMAVGAAAVQAVAESVKRAVRLATGLAGIAGLADAG